MKSTIMHYVAVMADGTRHDVTVCNPDIVRYEMTAAKHNWPKDATMLQMVFGAWHALKRTGIYKGDFETFRDTDCLALEIETDDKDDADDNLGKAIL